MIADVSCCVASRPELNNTRTIDMMDTDNNDREVVYERMWIIDPLRIGLWAVGAVLFALLAYAFFASRPASAESIAAKGGAPIPIGVVTEATNWNGFGVGIYGSWVGGQLDHGPGSPSAEGSVLGGQLSYSVQAGMFVAEIFGEYGFVFGDLSNLDGHGNGADAEIAAGGKLGILATPSTLIYALGAKSWIDPSEGDMIDGWQFGGGIAVKLPSAPLVLSLEYRRGLYEVEGFDVSTDTVRAGLTYKFGAK